MTELEIRYGVLENPKDMKNSAFFYLRNHEALGPNLPPSAKVDFESDSLEDLEKLACLKSDIKNKGFEVMDNYAANFSHIGNLYSLKIVKWSKIYFPFLDSNGIVKLNNLEAFGSRLFDNLWNAILNIHQTSKINKNFVQTDLDKQLTFCKSASDDFVGRIHLIKVGHFISSSSHVNDFGLIS